jgi:hypothetical protein
VEDLAKSFEVLLRLVEVSGVVEDSFCLSASNAALLNYPIPCGQSYSCKSISCSMVSQAKSNLLHQQRAVSKRSKVRGFANDSVAHGYSVVKDRFFFYLLCLWFRSR